MALQINPGSSAGYAITSTHELVFQLKENLKAVGWTVPHSGTGTSGAYAASDLITSAAVLNGTRAWFEIRDPAGGRSFVIQHISSGFSFRIKYAAAGGFGGGAPTENVMPAATTPAEEFVLLGAGTDASPSGSTFGSSSGTKYGTTIVDDAAPYGFCMYMRDAGTGADRCIFFMDPMIPGTYSNTDTDPVVVGARSAMSADIFATSAHTSSGGSVGWIKRASGGAIGAIGTVKWWGGATSAYVFPKLGGVDPESGEDITLPLVWIRNPSLGAPSGWKGISSLFEGMLATRANGDTLTRSTARDRIVLMAGEWCSAWNGSVPLV